MNTNYQSIGNVAIETQEDFNSYIDQLISEEYQYSMICPELCDPTHFLHNGNVYQTLEEVEVEAESQRSGYGREIEVWELEAMKEFQI